MFWISQYQREPWDVVVKKLQRSTVPITCSVHGIPMCSAFSINEPAGLYLTVNHCIQPFLSDEGQPEVPYLDGRPLDVVFVNEALDLAIVRSTTRRPALYYRQAPFGTGTSVASFGYAYGMPTPLFRTAQVAGVFYDPERVEWMALDNALIGGMSGGPIVDRFGRVVGINDKSDYTTGFSISLRELKDATEFWGEELAYEY